MVVTSNTFFPVDNSSLRHPQGVGFQGLEYLSQRSLEIFSHFFSGKTGWGGGQGSQQMRHKGETLGSCLSPGAAFRGQGHPSGDQCVGEKGWARTWLQQLRASLATGQREGGPEGWAQGPG